MYIRASPQLTPYMTVTALVEGNYWDMLRKVWVELCTSTFADCLYLFNRISHRAMHLSCLSGCRGLDCEIYTLVVYV